MLEIAEIGHHIAKSEYSARVPQLRADLLRMQFDLRELKIPAIIVIAGDDRPGLDDTIHRLNAWCDPRYLETRAFGPASQNPSNSARYRLPSGPNSIDIGAVFVSTSKVLMLWSRTAGTEISGTWFRTSSSRSL